MIYQQSGGIRTTRIPFGSDIATYLFVGLGRLVCVNTWMCKYVTTWIHVIGVTFKFSLHTQIMTQTLARGNTKEVDFSDARSQLSYRILCVKSPPRSTIRAYKLYSILKLLYNAL